MSSPINFILGKVQSSGELLVVFQTIDLPLISVALERALVSINPDLSYGTELEDNTSDSKPLLLITDTGNFDFIQRESTTEMFATSIDSVDAMSGIVELLKYSSDFKEVQEIRSVDTQTQSNHEPYHGGDDFEIDNTTWFTGF